MNFLLNDVVFSTHKLKIYDTISVFTSHPGICVLGIQNIYFILLRKKTGVGYHTAFGRYDNLVNLLFWLGEIEVLTRYPLQYGSLQIIGRQNPEIGKMDKGHYRHDQDTFFQHLGSLWDNDGAV